MKVCNNTGINCQYNQKMLFDWASNIITSVKTQQDRQCTCYVTLRRVRRTTVAVERNKYYVFLCVCVRAFLSMCVSVCVCVCARARSFICVCLWVYKRRNVLARV